MTYDIIITKEYDYGGDVDGDVKPYSHTHLIILV